MAFTRSPSLSNNPKILNNYLIFTAVTDLISNQWQGHLLSCPGQLNIFRYLARPKVPKSFLVQKEFWRDILKQVFERFVHPALHPGKCWPVVASGSGLVRVNLLQEIKPKYQDIYKHTITITKRAKTHLTQESSRRGIHK